MGSDKSKLPLGGITLLERIQRTVAPLKMKIRVIRKDAVPSCGPLGGIITALRTATAEGVLFLSNDMPFVPFSFLEEFVSRFGSEREARFTRVDERTGFPLLVRRNALTKVEQQRRDNVLALRELADRLDADMVKVSAKMADLFLNINTPEEWRRAESLWEKLRQNAETGGNRNVNLS